MLVKYRTLLNRKHITLAFLLLLPFFSQASTVVSMQTSLGDIQIELYDETAPQTVANFLNYVNSDAYTDSFIHRSMPGFVIQGGGFTWDTVNNTGYYNIPTDAPVVNEFGASNVRGTIAMAKLGGNPDSATSQWFFNLADNSANLDTQNGGFTVFGQVIGDGMQIVDQMAGLATENADSSVFSNLPLIDLNGGYNADNLVMVNNVQVVPLPAAAWLFGSVLLAGLPATRKRRRNP